MISPKWMTKPVGIIHPINNAEPFLSSGGSSEHPALTDYYFSTVDTYFIEHHLCSVNTEVAEHFVVHEQ